MKLYKSFVNVLTNLDRHGIIIIDRENKGEIQLKYMGSKARLSKDLSPIVNNLIKQNNIKTYIEPFVGGANITQHIVCENKIGSDTNE